MSLQFWGSDMLGCAVRRGRIKLRVQALAALLQVPQGHRIVAVREHDCEPGTMIVDVEGPGMPECREGQEPKSMVLVAETTTHQCGDGELQVSRIIWQVGS